MFVLVTVIAVGSTATESSDRSAVDFDLRICRRDYDCAFRRKDCEDDVDVEVNLKRQNGREKTVENNRIPECETVTVNAISDFGLTANDLWYAHEREIEVHGVSSCNR